MEMTQCFDTVMLSTLLGFAPFGLPCSLPSATNKPIEGSLRRTQTFTRCVTAVAWSHATGAAPSAARCPSNHRATTGPWAAHHIRWCSVLKGSLQLCIGTGWTDASSPHPANPHNSYTVNLGIR